MNLGPFSIEGGSYAKRLGVSWPSSLHLWFRSYGLHLFWFRGWRHSRFDRCRDWREWR
jgi:hypothetical protein